LSFIAKFNFAYKIKEQGVATPGAFKKQRIIEALTGNNETNLLWQFTACLNNCEQEKKSLQRANYSL